MGSRIAAAVALPTLEATVGEIGNRWGFAVTASRDIGASANGP
ncbi:hypothetical protein [Natrinema salaciae]|nr:hypothetical protein [Natrinema salaciae]